MKGIFLSDYKDEISSIEENYHEYVGKDLIVEIERPIGFKHITGVIYRLNYGFIPNTIGKDGDEIDVYILDECDKLPIGSRIDVKIIGAIIRFDNCDDIETKYVAVKNKQLTYTKEEIRKLTNFMECKFKTIIVV